MLPSAHSREVAREHESVRRTKFELSWQADTTFEFRCERVSISRKVTRVDFEKWIQIELRLMVECVDRLLGATGASTRDIDHVFLTAGSSFVPAVREDLYRAVRVEKRLQAAKN